MLRVNYFLSRHCFLMDGDAYDYFGASYVVGDDVSGNHANKVNLEERFVKSFAPRLNNGKQPMPDDFPVIVTWSSGATGTTVSNPHGWIIDNYDSIVSWVPDIEKLIEQQAEFDAKQNPAEPIILDAKSKLPRKAPTPSEAIDKLGETFKHTTGNKMLNSDDIDWPDGVHYAVVERGSAKPLDFYGVRGGEFLSFWDGLSPEIGFAIKGRSYKKSHLYLVSRSHQSLKESPKRVFTKEMKAKELPVEIGMFYTVELDNIIFSCEMVGVTFGSPCNVGRVLSGGADNGMLLSSSYDECLPHMTEEDHKEIADIKKKARFIEKKYSVPYQIAKIMIEDGEVNKE